MYVEQQVLAAPDRLWRQARSAFRALFIVALLASSCCTVAAAADLTPDERTRLETERNTLFQRMVRTPSDLEVTFHYADVSAQLGDNEAAISALERMLLFNPKLPRVQLELGALYFRMGSYDLARDYFDKAGASNPPPEVREKVTEYLAEIERRSSRHTVSGYVFFGGQFQSNANVSPASPIIRSPIGDVLLGSEFQKKADENVFAAGSVLYSYDLETQNRDAVEVTGTAFINHYFRVRRLDLGIVEATAGPRFNFPNAGLIGSGGATAKPYLILNDVLLGRNQFFNTYGFGGEYGETVWYDIGLKGIFEFRQKNYSDAVDRPVSRGLNGSDKIVSLSATKAVTPDSTLSVSFDFVDQTTRLDYYSNKSYGINGSYRVRYDDPVKLTPFPWETTFTLSRSWNNYSSADPCCNTSPDPFFTSTSERLDRRWRFGVTQAIVFAPDAAILLQFQRDIVSSNLSLYRYTSNTVLIGPQIRF